MDENTAADMNIGAPVAAMDGDRGDTLTYTLDNALAASFAIDEDTGQLKTADPLAESIGSMKPMTSYMVTVTVTDGKDAVGTVDTNAVADDTITVTITVTDVNDAPEFADELPSAKWLRTQWQA